MTTREQIVTAIGHKQWLIDNARAVIKSNEDSIVENFNHIERYKAQLAELELAVQETVEDEDDEARDIRLRREARMQHYMYGNLDTTGRRKTHSLPEALSIWVWWYGTQSAAASALGMEKGYFSRLLSGAKANPRDDKLALMWLERTGYGNRFAFVLDRKP